MQTTGLGFQVGDLLLLLSDGQPELVYLLE